MEWLFHGQEWGSLAHFFIYVTKTKKALKLSLSMLEYDCKNIIMGVLGCLEEKKARVLKEVW